MTRLEEGGRINFRSSRFHSPWGADRQTELFVCARPLDLSCLIPAVFAKYFFASQALPADSSFRSSRMPDARHDRYSVGTLNTETDGYWRRTSGLAVQLALPVNPAL